MPLARFDKSILPDEGRETSRDEILSKFLSDDSLNDIALEGTDGVKVKANRHILAARSDVLHGMLLGRFEESKKEVIKIGYKGSVLKAIVEYILSDTAELLDDIKKKGGAEIDLNDVEKIQSLVSLTGAADYFYFPELCEKAFNTLAQCLENVPGLVFSALEVWSQDDGFCITDLGQSIQRMALSCLSSYYNCIQAVNSSTVESLSEPILEMILKEDESRMDEYQLFELVRLWINSQPDRRTAAIELMKQYIILENIETKTLSTTVKESGYFSVKQLMEAYENQALAWQPAGARGLTTKRPRCLPVWKSSGTEKLEKSGVSGNVVDVIDCLPMTTGIHRWVVKVGRYPSNSRTFLGVAMSTSDQVDSSQLPTWTELIPLNAYREEEITITLNLLPESKGELTWQVDGEAPRLIARELLERLNSPRTLGFLPAARIQQKGLVHLIKMTHLLEAQT